jgi:hypothetical protein
MIGARRSPGTRPVPAGHVHRRRRVERATSVSGRERPLDTLTKSGVTNFYWQYFQNRALPKQSSSAMSALRCARSPSASKHPCS